jgi:uroporphyrin-III C-methyltransferase
MIHPKLTLVGGGPGDPELFTLKGINALKQADIILYDALVNTELLEHANKDIPKIFVGKREGEHSYTQSQINDLIVDSAFTYGHVVRLKGGDPFVFGRGYEELQFAQKFNIPTSYVPGISSAISVPGLQHIPVTHRGVSNGFRVITATRSDKSLSEDIIDAAQGNTTAIILMGLKKLDQIVSIYKLLGKHNTPVAIIQSGSSPAEKIVLGNITTIKSIAYVKEIQAPAIIVIGDVVALHPDFTPDLAPTRAPYTN